MIIGQFEDKNNYEMSTKKTNQGVLFGLSKDGSYLIPFSSYEMKHCSSGRKEFKKVCKLSVW